MKSLMQAIAGSKRKPRGLMPQAPKLDLQKSPIRSVLGRGPLGKPAQPLQKKVSY